MSDKNDSNKKKKGTSKKTSKSKNTDKKKKSNSKNIDSKKKTKSANKSTKKTKKNKENMSMIEIENNKNGKVKFSKRHPRISLTIKIIFLLIIALIAISVGILAGMIYGSWGDDFEITEEELTISSSNSVVLDSDENQLAELTGDENRKIIRIEEMPENLLNAYIAIEDERFYEHNGIDIKRTAGAIFQYITNGGTSSYGGSTITQQLVKNITEDDEDTGIAGALRKVKEWAKAYQIEQLISKEQILELYLNIIFVGGNNYGVERGAEYYFNKTASELDLAECAFLAGINNAPNSYSPYSETDNSEKIKNRTETVLNKMLELGMISQEEYDTAYAKVEEGLVFEQAESSGTIYSYHTDATIAQVIEDVAEEKGISTSLATTYVYSSGLTIYSTQNSTVQSQVEEVYVTNASSYSRTVSGETSQAAMVVIDNETGYVVAVAGGLGEKTESRGLNRATQSTRQTGSSIKPLSSLVPGLSEGTITAATIYDDSSTEFTVGTTTWTPKDYNAFKGLISIRSAITTSQNIPFAKVVTELGTETCIEYLEKMGFTSISDSDHGAVAAIALGGFTNGISPLEMAGAYATIANDGVYRTPLFYTKVTDSNGETVLEANQETEQVFTEQVAYVIKDLLKSVVSSGTATYCSISGMDVAAKTGTTNDNTDKWLCGFTNYYTAASWYGFDQNQEVTGSTNVAGRMWAAVMTKVHSGKESSTFTQPSGIVTATICKTTGKKATSRCSNTYTEIFVEGTVPDDCDGHGNSAQICSDTGLLATEYCPNVVTKYYSYTVEKENLGLWKTSSSSSSPPTSYCTEHTSATSTTTSDTPTITLKGDKSMTLTVGDSYSEQGATATDDTDGDISAKIKISGTVNTSKAGTYTVTYTVTNSLGNTATETRTITVKAKETAANTSSGGNSSTATNTTNTTTSGGGGTPSDDEEDDD